MVKKGKERRRKNRRGNGGKVENTKRDIILILPLWIWLNYAKLFKYLSAINDRKDDKSQRKPIRERNEGFKRAKTRNTIFEGREREGGKVGIKQYAGESKLQNKMERKKGNR